MATVPAPDEDDLYEAGIDLGEFRLLTQNTIYNVIALWVNEAHAAIKNLREAREALMDASVYGDYRSIRGAADFVGKILESSNENLLIIGGQFDSPLQIKAALADREGGQKLSPIVDALFKLDGTSRENLRVAFLTLLNDAQKIQAANATEVTANATSPPPTEPVDEQSGTGVPSVAPADEAGDPPPATKAKRRGSGGPRANRRGLRKGPRT